MLSEQLWNLAIIYYFWHALSCDGRFICLVDKITFMLIRSDQFCRRSILLTQWTICSTWNFVKSRNGKKWKEQEMEMEKNGRMEKWQKWKEQEKGGGQNCQVWGLLMPSNFLKKRFKYHLYCPNFFLVLQYFLRINFHFETGDLSKLLWSFLW